MIGLETAVPLVLELVRAGLLTPATMVTRMSTAPARRSGSGRDAGRRRARPTSR